MTGNCVAQNDSCHRPGTEWYNIYNKMQAKVEFLKTKLNPACWR